MLDSVRPQTELISSLSRTRCLARALTSPSGLSYLRTRAPGLLLLQPPAPSSSSSQPPSSRHPVVRQSTSWSVDLLKPKPGHSTFCLQAAEGATAADQMAALLGPGMWTVRPLYGNICKVFSHSSDQMAALLGPSWKSRQPRMCQYCQRMFSNKFNLKQVGTSPNTTAS